MSKPSQIYRLLFVVGILIVVNFYLIHLDWQAQNKGLTLAMLDVGQGDAIYVESPTGTQIMFDAGPQNKIIGSLARVMSPFDKSIDAIVITNPDADHIGGFREILENYEVSQAFEAGTFNASKTYHNLEAEIREKNIPNFLLKKGMRLDIGGGAYIDILFPDRDVSTYSSNDGSVVARLVYGETSVVLTGDATSETEKIVSDQFSPDQLNSTILKVAHHGSKTSSLSQFVEAVSPEYALISNGKDNKYGHPHRETLDTLEEFGARVFRTDLLGTIIMRSDGQNETFSFIK